MSSMHLPSACTPGCASRNRKERPAGSDLQLPRAEANTHGPYGLRELSAAELLAASSTTCASSALASVDQMATPLKRQGASLAKPVSGRAFRLVRSARI